MLIRHAVLAVKIETTYRTDASPGATDTIAVTNATPPASEGLRLIERKVIRSSISPLKPIFAGRLGKVTFDVELKGSGSAGTAPETDALLRACGQAVTISAGTSVVYNPASEDHESCTIYYYLDGIRYIMTGCRGKYTLTNDLGGDAIPMASFEMVGHVSQPTDASVITPTYDSTVPVPLIGLSFAIGGYGAVINAFNFDLGAELAFNPSMNEANGYGEVTINGFNPTGSFDPENTLVATQDWIGDFEDGVSKVLTSGNIGSVAGNIVKIDCPAISYTEVGNADRDGTATLDTQFVAIDDAGDDFISLSFL